MLAAITDFLTINPYWKFCVIIKHKNPWFLNVFKLQLPGHCAMKGLNSQFLANMKK